MSTAQATRTVTLERRSDINLESYRRVAREGARIVIGDGASERMSAAREAFLALVESDPSAFIYGVTTSAGDGASTLIDPEQRRALARMLGRSGASFGERLPERVVRGMVLTRLTGMIEGNSGVRPELARAVAGMLESEPLPAVPSQGNGGSGEIIALGHLFGPLSSRTVEDSREAMSLINGSPCASALVADAALSGRNRLGAIEAVCALAAETIRTPDEQHSPLLETLWEEQHEVAALQSLRTLLAGGLGDRRHFQAPVSFRILPRVLGRLRRAQAEAERAATSSLAAVSDNPVFVPPCEGHPLGATLSNGSYHNAQAPPAMDGLSAAWADVCQVLERQTERLLTDPTVFGEGHVPVKILYMVQTWWAEEARAAAQPTLIPLGGYGQNDTCAPSFFAWRRQEQVGRCLDAALAIVAAISSQALSEGGRSAPPALAGLLEDVRARFPVVTEAHPLGEEAGRLADWFTDCALA
jgi:histidine ammonia-lyase